MMKRRVYIWGAGDTGRKVYLANKDSVEMLGFIDTSSNKQGTKHEGFPVYAPDVLCKTVFDAIIVGTVGGQDIPDQLKSMGISPQVLDSMFVDSLAIPRVTFLKSFASMMEGKAGAVAEAGVFRGDFAKEINQVFPHSPCFLFDTFEGFDSRDIQCEKIQTDSMQTGHLSYTTEELVSSKMPHKECVKIFKGYFPETVTPEVLEQEYLFVNLDMDLYKPTLEGLRIFWPRMVEGGVILVHDFFSNVYPNVRTSIYDFEKELGYRIHKIPIGDELSIALIK